MEKKEYVTPTIEVIVLQQEDIIRTSGVMKGFDNDIPIGNLGRF